MVERLEIDSVWLEFGLRKILTDIYLKCETGKITALLGRNGQGKSCLMNIISGNQNTSERSVRLNGAQVTKYNPKILLYLPQFNFIPAYLTLKRVWKDFELDFSLFEKRFPEFSTKYQQRFSNLSGGQRRLAEVYLIACAKTRFILLDEPFSHIMPLHVEKIKELLTEEKQNKGILLTDHMYRHVTGISDYLYVLDNGKTRLMRDAHSVEIPGYNTFVTEL